jgi:hypothetical protein
MKNFAILKNTFTTMLKLRTVAGKHRHAADPEEGIGAIGREERHMYVIG